MRGVVNLRWLAWSVACFVYLAADLNAKSADFPSTAPAVPAIPDQSALFVSPAGGPGTQFEARFGLFYHGVGSNEHNTFDLNGSVLSPRLDLGVTGYWAYFLPRFQLGGAANLSGRTSFAYADAAFTLPITQWLFFEPFVGGAVHDGSLTPTPTLAGLGCPLLFHAGVSLGVPINQHWSVIGTFEHLSNGKSLFGVDCGTNQSATGSNQGLNNYGLSVGYAF
jgi:Lipid A 3-O-deacylase (PagL)